MAEVWRNYGTLKRVWEWADKRGLITFLHKLNNLIWVWNSQVPECYPGDDVVDIISRDMYPPNHVHTSQGDMYFELLKITEQPKIALIGEIGSLPDVDAIHDEKIVWASFMTWSGVFCLSEECSSRYLKKLYESPNTVTKETLPELY